MAASDLPTSSQRATQDGPGAQGDDRRFEALGAQLMLRLSAALRTAKTHDIANQAFQRQLQDFLATVQALFEFENEVTLAAVADYFYLDGRRLKANATLLPTYHGLLGEFERRAIGGIRILQGVHLAELERFFQLFIGAESAAIAEHLTRALEEAQVEHVQIVPASALDADDLARELAEHREKTERGSAKRVFWQAVLGTKRLVARAQATGRPDLRQAKRLVQPVVDSIMNHEYSLVGLTAVKDHDEYTYAHCVNVSVLSVGIGQALGLSRQVLADVGVAGLVHDIGKLAVPGDVLRKPSRLSAEEWELMRRHPLEGVKMTMRMPGLSMLTLDTMRVCLEHHMSFDRSGYPTTVHDWGQSTLSRIVAAADCFDAISAHRSYHRRPRTPFEALQYMLGPARLSFDPAALWGLVQTVGLYPAGTILKTDTGHLVLAISPNPSDPRRPACRVLLDPDQNTPKLEETVEWDPMPSTVSVVEAVRPEELAFSTAELLGA